MGYTSHKFDLKDSRESISIKSVGKSHIVCGKELAILIFNILKNKRDGVNTNVGNANESIVYNIADLSLLASYTSV